MDDAKPMSHMESWSRQAAVLFPRSPTDEWMVGDGRGVAVPDRAGLSPV